ncbi:TatD family hydrolase [Oceanospirillum sediminis]|uniref:TatD family hydrolase n=1 Tax=Oceanospirillum sediminis TaxID=2760088 RepID=A0A839IRF1_9GAMM|nr:TatD family hydrolase [Oceanospirillum sediminis]MBB1487885.1 TatD family hydrolase [Oceanospirillum sediminis]
MLIDSHCHLDFEDFHHDRAEVLRAAVACDVRKIVVPGISARHWKRVLYLHGEICGVQLYPALGLHPFFLEEHREDDLQILDQYLQQYRERVVAVGEVGLDFSRKTDKTTQLSLFRAQLELADRYQLPVILHVVKAHEQVIALLKEFPEVKGIVHGYSGSLPQAKQYIRQGFLLGVGGVITWPKSDKKRAMFAQLPLESLALETDSPDMPPSDIRGQRNTPAQIAVVLDKLVQLRSESRETIARVTTGNVLNLFNSDV